MKKIVKVENGLGIGSKMSPVLAELIMKRWENENVENEERIRQYGRYVDDSLGVWKGSKNELEEKVKRKGHN